MTIEDVWDFVAVGPSGWRERDGRGESSSIRIERESGSGNDELTSSEDRGVSGFHGSRTIRLEGREMVEMRAVAFGERERES